MDQFKIATWNSNGLTQRRQEVEVFLTTNQIDILLISEAHFTDRTYFKIPGFRIYDTKHPNGNARGGTAILIRQNIKHYEATKYETDYLQATTVMVTDWRGPLAVSAVYCPPRYRPNKDGFIEYFQTLGTRFISGGDFNAKHYQWGSRLCTPRGRILQTVTTEKHYNTVSTGKPTYWPTDLLKIPDCIDIFITNGIAITNMMVDENFDLCYDHSPVILTLSSSIMLKTKAPQLHTHLTNWDEFRETLDKNLSLNVSLKSNEDIENAVEILTTTTQNTAWNATPTVQAQPTKQRYLPEVIMDKISQKRRLRKIWQTRRYPEEKRRYNNACRELKKLISDYKNEAFARYLEGLTATEATDYSLWKATKRLKQPQQTIPPIRRNDGSWAKSDSEKAEVFVEHLGKVFQPDEAISATERDEIQNLLDVPLQLSLPIKYFSVNEVRKMIEGLKDKKSPGYDLITGRVLKELPHKGTTLITYIFNAILRIGYFPAQWKTAKIILILKPGKPAYEVTSYRPISLLPILSKLFEKLLMKRLMPILHETKIIPEHQFGFRKQHSTIEQVHRVVHYITAAFEAKQYCPAIFIDVSQAFDKVWHEGLLLKLKQCLPDTFYVILKSYLQERHFLVKHEEEMTKLVEIKAGVPQGSVMGPLLYLIFTADLPTDNNAMYATFADDTAILTTDENPVRAVQKLQNSLDHAQEWFKKWHIKLNETKSVYVPFTKRRGICPPIALNGKEILPSDSAKYLGIHIDKTLTWRTHIWKKRLQLNLKFKSYYWLLGRNSQLSLDNKLLIYKVIFKPVWLYGIQIWGTASNSNISILERLQSKILRTITNAPQFITNAEINIDLKMNTIKSEIVRASEKYLVKLEMHPNSLALNLLDNSEDNRRLKRYYTLDLPYRFN